MVTLNGRFSSNKDNFTVISSVGKSVVDYAIVQADHFRNYSSFQVKTVLDILEYYSIPSDSPAYLQLYMLGFQDSFLTNPTR